MREGKRLVGFLVLLLRLLRTGRRGRRLLLFLLCLPPGVGLGLLAQAFALLLVGLFVLAAGIELVNRVGLHVGEGVDRRGGVVIAVGGFGVVVPVVVVLGRVTLGVVALLVTQRVFAEEAGRRRVVVAAGVGAGAQEVKQGLGVQVVLLLAAGEHVGAQVDGQGGPVLDAHGVPLAGGEGGPGVCGEEVGPRPAVDADGGDFAEGGVLVACGDLAAGVEQGLGVGLGVVLVGVLAVLADQVAELVLGAAGVGLEDVVGGVGLVEDAFVVVEVAGDRGVGTGVAVCGSSKAI